jgi:hypothetical protein
MTTTTLEGYERAGLVALVRAGEAKDWFHGHVGAAMIAGARLLAHPDLPGRAATALGRMLDGRLVADREWLRPLAESETSSRGPDPLLERLRADAGVLRNSGHSTIYGATALHVLARHPEWATPRVIAGLVALHDAGREDDPGRYYGVRDYFELIERHSASEVNAAGSSIDAFRRAIEALGHRVADRDIDGRHYYLTGEKIHLVTHAHAIATFEALGHTDVAARALRAQHALEVCVAPSESLEATSLDPIGTRPEDAAFWEQPVFDEAHVVKLAEAVVAERARLPETERLVVARRMGAMWPMLGLR